MKDLIEINGKEQNPEPKFIVHDMTGSIPDQPCITRSQAEAWVQHLWEWQPNARPVIQSIG